MADETTDKSIKTQLSIVIRYLKVDTSTKRCSRMINQSNLKGKALVETILSHLKTVNLPLEKMIGQGYGWSEFYLRERKRRSSDRKRVLLTSWICLLFGTCIEFSVGKILCNT